MLNAILLSRLAFGHAHIYTGTASMAAEFRHHSHADRVALSLQAMGIKFGRSPNGLIIAILTGDF